jgi:hypothetical protein
VAGRPLQRRPQSGGLLAAGPGSWSARSMSSSRRLIASNGWSLSRSAREFVLQHPRFGVGELAPALDRIASADGQGEQRPPERPRGIAVLVDLRTARLSGALGPSSVSYTLCEQLQEQASPGSRSRRSPEPAARPGGSS